MERSADQGADFSIAWGDAQCMGPVSRTAASRVKEATQHGVALASDHAHTVTPPHDDPILRAPAQQTTVSPLCTNNRRYTYIHMHTHTHTHTHTSRASAARAHTQSLLPPIGPFPSTLPATHSRRLPHRHWQVVLKGEPAVVENADPVAALVAVPLQEGQQEGREIGVQACMQAGGQAGR